jgi:two-component system, sensor histidine kinase PdtaS
VVLAPVHLRVDQGNSGEKLEGPGTSVLEGLPLGRDRPWMAYGCTFLICLFSFGVRLLVSSAMPLGYPYIAFFPTVMLATFLFGVRPGIFAGLLCGIAAWYCFLPPMFEVKLSRSVLAALVFYSVVVTINIALIHTLQRMNRRLIDERECNRVLVERGELLFRELQHRVSNNLQVVSGLLALQMRDISDERARLALDESARRLSLIGRIHRQLYSPHGDQLQLSAFLEQLGADLIDAAGKPGVELQVKIDEEVELPAEAAVPVALIVAEAVANAIEHGFAGRDEGHILIRALMVGDALEIVVADDGSGLPAGFAIERSDSLGLKLARMLALQLAGEFGLSSDDGTIARLRLPLA